MIIHKYSFECRSWLYFIVIFYLGPKGPKYCFLQSLSALHNIVNFIPWSVNLVHIDLNVYFQRFPVRFNVTNDVDNLWFPLTRSWAYARMFLARFNVHRFAITTIFGTCSARFGFDVARRMLAKACIGGSASLFPVAWARNYCFVIDCEW